MKTVICFAILFLVQEGRLSFEDRIVDYFPEAVPADCGSEMRRLTVRNVLNMSVGQELDALKIFHATNCGAGMIPYTLRGQGDALGFDPRGMTLEQIFFSIPMVFRPGERFYYVNTVPELLIRLVTKAGGTDFIRYLRPRLFEPLDVTIFNCQETWMEGWRPEGTPRRPYDPVAGYLDGSTAVTSTKDLSKFALFLLQEGSWEGRQLLSQELIREATSMLIPTWDYAERVHGGDRSMSCGYGMQIWRNPFGGCQMLGGSGQAAIVVPDLELVIVYNSMNAHLAERGTVMPEIVERLYRKMRKYAIPEDRTAYLEMQKQFAAWTIAPAHLAPAGAQEAKWNGRRELAEPVDGITAMDFDFPSRRVVIRQGQRRCTVAYGTGGDFVRSPAGPEHPYSGYSFVYGGDLAAVSASGGWEDETRFVLQLQYDCQMDMYRYHVRFLEGGGISVQRES